jgi:hypothetical protein
MGRDWGMTRLSVLLAPNRPPLELVRTAGYIEAAGLDGVWVADHLEGGRHFSAPWYGMLTCLSAIALGTSTLRLGPLVAGMPMRPAATLAVELASLEALAPGRLLAAVGSGNERDAAVTGLSRGGAHDLAMYVWEVAARGMGVLVAASDRYAVKAAGLVGHGWVTAGKRPAGGGRRVGVDSDMVRDVAAARKVYDDAGGKGPCVFLYDVMEASPWASEQAMRETLALWGGEGFDEVVVFAPEHYGEPGVLSYGEAAAIRG